MTFPLGYDPSDFGADEIVRKPNAHGGYHYTAYKKQGGQISWDTDANDDYVEGSIHLSDRNVPGDGEHSSW